MIIQYCGNGRDHNPSMGTCDEYSVSGIHRMEDLLQTYRDMASTHSGFRPLLSLDDLSQAYYTSGHARHTLGLDDATEQDIAGLPAECFEHGEYLGYPSTKAEFAIGLRNLSRVVEDTSFEDACAHGLTMDEPGLQEWLTYQEDPVALLDQPVSMLLVPVQQACMALAAFPNGYFSADLDTAKNVAVARHLSLVHGYELMGVGASYLGFLRAEAPGPSVMGALASDFCALYNVPDEHRAAVMSVVTQAISGRTYLWVRYVE